MTEPVKFSSLNPGQRFRLASESATGAIMMKMSAREAKAIGWTEENIIFDELSGEVSVVPLTGVFEFTDHREAPKVELGLYEHYQRGLVDVLGTGTDHDSKLPIVFFLVHQTGTYWTRTLSDFQSFVDIGNGVQQPRFRKVQ